MRYRVFKDLHKVNDQKVIPALLRAAEHSRGDIASRLQAEAQKIEGCGETINTVKCNDCGTNHFKGATRCKSKYCAYCQKVKSNLWVVELFSWLKQWREQGNYIVFCTFTLKDTKSLAEGKKQLEGAWRMMTTKYRKMFMQHFPGGFKSLEVKTGAGSKEWHPHLHVLFCKREKSNDTYFLKYVWPKCVAAMGGVANPPNIKTIKPKSRLDRFDADYWNKALLDSLREVCKYMTVLDWDEEPPESIGELYENLYGSRQFAVWGVLSYIRQAVNNAMDKKTDDEIEEFVCQVCGCTRGSPNKLYKDIWQDAFVLDFKTSTPEVLASPSMIERIKLENGFLTQQQAKSQWKWVQERIDAIPPPRPD